MNKWILCGDVHPLTYGGYFIKEDVCQDCYRVIYVNEMSGSIKKYLCTELYVDMSASWINENEVRSYVGLINKSYKLNPIDVIEYYGIYEFGGSYADLYLFKKDVYEQLRKYGITKKYK